MATPATCLAELKRKRIKTKRPWKTEIAFIQIHSQIAEVNKEVALLAGEIQELHFADALVYATALALNGTVITGDPHFKDLPHVQYIGP